MSNSLYDMEPNEDASIEEWQAWASRLCHRAKGLEEKYSAANSSKNKYKKEVIGQQLACKYYKSELSMLNNTLEQLKSNWAYRALKFLSSIKGRFRL